jgi:subtilisin family serine protease
MTTSRFAALLAAIAAVLVSTRAGAATDEEILDAGAATSPAGQPPRDPAACDAHPEQVLVRFKDEATPPLRAAAHLAAGAIETLHEYRHVSGLVLVRVKSGLAAAAVAIYNADPSVRYAERDALLRPTVIPNDPFYGVLWGLHNTGQGGGVPDADIDAPEAWSTWTGDSNFVVAVLDTGIALSHPDLAANIWSNPGEILDNRDNDGNGYVDDLHGLDTINDDSNPEDDMGHGTHCAGTIGARGGNGIGVVGVNWQCRLAAIKFIGPNSFCPLGGGLLSDCVQAMEYVIDEDIKVSSNSYGCTGSLPQSLYDVIAVSQSIGHIFVAAAGNNASNNDATPFWPSSFNLSNVISVAATDSSDQLASFSNHGSSTVDLGAPGVGVLSTWLAGGYAYSNGTSMACPHVAGVVALVWSRAPQLSWQEVRDVVLDTARPIPALAGKTVTGGVVNAKDALAAACVPPSPGDIWVDFAFNGAECGSSANPFDSLAEAVAVVGSGGTISIKPGSTNETASGINKPLTLKAVGGTVTIGQ